MAGFHACATAEPIREGASEPANSADVFKMVLKSMFNPKVEGASGLMC
jgi:hypothetical protein